MTDRSVLRMLPVLFHGINNPGSFATVDLSDLLGEIDEQLSAGLTIRTGG